MTFPGVQGITGRGVLGLTPIGQQVRQSRAGQALGNPYAKTVLTSMGSFAPAWGVTALAVNAREEAIDSPHTIEKDNFELSESRGGKFQFGVDPTDPSYFEDHAVDPIEPGQPEYTGR
jgi:hypothetical protein